jgi:hypothetical protein
MAAAAAAAAALRLTNQKLLTRLRRTRKRIYEPFLGLSFFFYY